MMAIAWLELGEYETASMFFEWSYEDMHPPFNVFYELPLNVSQGGCWNFITGYGAFLQTLINGIHTSSFDVVLFIIAGFGGIRVQDDFMQLFPQLPPQATAVKYRRVTASLARK